LYTQSPQMATQFLLLSCLAFTYFIPPLARMGRVPHLHWTKERHLAAR
jgi:hypothetical protein